MVKEVAMLLIWWSTSVSIMGAASTILRVTMGATCATSVVVGFDHPSFAVGNAG